MADQHTLCVESRTKDLYLEKLAKIEGKQWYTGEPR